MTTPADRIPISRKLAIGAGDLGLNLYWQFATLFLLFFYTDALGVPATVAGAIYMAALIVDAALDPVVGLFADRTKTRFGRYRPYLLIGAVPLALIFVLNFVRPFDNATASLIFVAVAHVAFRAVYTVVGMPYIGLFARVTQSSVERSDMAGIRMFFGAAATIGVAAGTQPLVRLLGVQGSATSGWMGVAVAYGVAATLLLWLSAWGSAGLDRADEPPPPRASLPATFRIVMKNRALLVILVAVMISSFTSTMFSKNVLYYFKYVLEREDAIGTVLGLGALAATLAAPAWTLLMRRLDKRATWFVSTGVVIVGFLMWPLADGMGLAAHLASLLVQSIGSAGVAVAMWAMLPDTVEYGQWREGVRIESFSFGLAVLFQKAALGLGAGALGLALGWIGYQPNVAQTPETLASLKSLMFWIPLAGKVVAAVVMLQYPMRRGDHERIRLELEARATVGGAP